ncbi:YraN family protein [Flavobacterium sp. MAH-1]|uniref:UPF0102 protein HZF10_05030 n=1 Tax=Flavobacterium agri TaxID=2743471 RepID=A0A7Y9C4V4_9FLAO|nr:YraN family protein [Flavobacterium agri]NUY80250.1 YraN family protein [Flavobacterium agri]NYA70275.1 YraN family protein [Flavobacterium agri]
MALHNELGKKGEELAVAFLFKHGYEILETNWICGKAEIDIIARKGNLLAVVEVKTRSSVVFGLPQDFVTPKKIQMLTKAVNEFVQSYALDCEVRFDIIGVTLTQTGHEIEHLCDAFYYF